MRQTIDPESVKAHVGRPVHFQGGSVHGNELAVRRLDEACRHAGVYMRDSLAEPVAASLAYLHDHNPGDGYVLTFDFGGGTLDLAVVSCSTTGAPEVVVTHGAALGGDHIDQRLFESLLFPRLGKGERWRRRGMERMIDTPFPFERYEPLLLNWSTGYLMNQGEFRGPVAEMARAGGEAGGKFQRLYDLIVYNLGYEVFHALRSVKETLSVAVEATLDIPEIDVALRITRGEFEHMIGDLLAEIAQAIDDTLDKAGLPAERYAAVICTGGSSLIPAVQALFDTRLPGKRVTYDPFTSVAAGLAMADYRAQRAA